MTETPEPFETGPGGPPQGPTDAHAEDISGVDNWLEEGGPLEPADVAEVEGADAPVETGPGGPPQGPPSAPAGGEGGDGDDLVVTRIALEERTLDLQRLQAEYVNYKRRVERDRDLVVQNAKFSALAPIVDVLDNIDRAREHEELDGGFKSVAEQLERVVAAAGLVKYGEPGDAFDPMVHEALSHIGQDPEVTVTTCKVIAKAGYKIGDRVVRAAQVLVVDPADG